MPRRIDISDFRCYNQLKNGADFSLNTGDFATTLVGNVGELVRVQYKATFNYNSFASLGNSWDVKAGKITRQTGNFQTNDGLVEGDVFVFFSDWANSDTATPEFTGTVTGFSDGGATVLFSVTGAQTTTGTQSNVGFICDTATVANRHTAMFLRFGLVSNDDTYSNASLLTGAPQGYAVVGMAGITAPITGTWEGVNLDSKTGSFTAYIITENTADRSVTYQITHDFIILPTYIAGQLTNLQNAQPPANFEGAQSLKYTFQLELRKAKTSTATAKTLTFDSLAGAVGWFNENFNGTPSPYSLAAIAYQDTTLLEAKDALQLSRKTTATITLTGTFTAGQNVSLFIQYLPLRASEYSNTATDFPTNFLYDSLLVAEGAGAVTGTGIIKSFNALIDSSNLVITADFEYTTEQALIIEGGSYLIGVSVADTSLSNADSNRVALLADVRVYEALGLISGLLAFNKFEALTHNQTLGVDTGSIVPSAWNEDGLLIDFEFELDLAKEAVIDELAFKLVAFKTADETYFELDRYVIDCTNFAVSAGVQQLQLDTTRGYALASGDQFNFVKLATGARVGDIVTYTGSFGQKITWQDWIANANADTVFFDNAEPNNNLNQKASNYSGLEGYAIKIIAEATLTGVDDLGNAGNGFERGEVQAVLVYDYDVSDDGAFAAGNIQTLAIDGVTDTDGLVMGDELTIFRTTWTTADASLSNVWAVHRLDLINTNGQNTIQEISTIYPALDVSALSPVLGESLLKLYASGGDIITECYVDGRILNNALGWQLSARIERVSEAFTFFTVFNNATSAPFVASVVNSAAGTWVFGGNVEAGNSLSTSNAYFDGSLRAVQYKAASFTGLTEIDIDDTQGRGVLDLSSAIFNNLTDLRAANNLFSSMLFGLWIRTAFVSIDVTNSVLTEATLSTLIDNIIIANGGTTTDDGSNYTGLPGITAASRVLIVGTLEIDLIAPENVILYQKIIALETVGWTITTITTVCQKTFAVNSGAALTDVVTIERTRQFTGIEYISGGVIDIDLYDTLANANAAGATGRLAQGFASVNAYVLNDINYDAWLPAELRALRVYSIDGVTDDSISNIGYKAAPTLDRPCGTVTDVGGFANFKAQQFDGSFNYNIISSLLSPDFNNPGTIMFRLKIAALSSGGRMLSTEGVASANNTFHIGFGTDNNFVVNIGTSKKVLTTSDLGISGIDRNYIFTVTWDGINAATFNIYIDAVDDTIVFSNTPLTYAVTANNTHFGDRPAFDRKFNGAIATVEYVAEKIGAGNVATANADLTLRNVVSDLSVYRLAIDFDKNNGENPTTFAGTPLYTITAFGGSTYIVYP